MDGTGICLLQLRIQGKEDDVNEFIKLLKILEPFVEIVSESESYKNRNDANVRKYLT